MYNKRFEGWYKSLFNKFGEICGYKLPDGLTDLLARHEDMRGELSKSERRMLFFEYWGEYISSKKKI